MKPIRAFLFAFSVLLIFILASSIMEDKANSMFSIFKFHEHETSHTQANSKNKSETSGLKQSIPLYQPSVTTTEDITDIHSSFYFDEDDSSRLYYLSDQLKSLSEQNTPLRILYFGDSQIEGDRITSSIRKELQAKWGGSGPGLIAANQYYNTKHQLIINLSEGWETTSYQDSSYVNQSLTFRNTKLTGNTDEQWIQIGRIKAIDPQPDYTRLRIFYTSEDSCKLKTTDSGQIISETILVPTNKIEEAKLTFAETPDNLKLFFSSPATVSLMGISLESKNGIMVDNISLRGVTYPNFTSSDQEKLQQMLSFLNPGLFILNFGVNLVPYYSDYYVNYETKLKKQITFLNQVFPEVPVLIIGVSDMAHLENGTLISYSNIDQIKELQKKIARETHSAFWDLEDFMGGSGSIIKWVNSNPPLARKDYTHFTEEGATLVGNKIAELLINEIDQNSIR